jgi:hypothetical protein
LLEQLNRIHPSLLFSPRRGFLGSLVFWFCAST